MIIVALFILTRLINTFFPQFWSKLFCCCRGLEDKLKKLKDEKYKFVVDKAYSNNIYKEI